MTRHESVVSAVSSLKEIVTIITGLTITNGMITLLRSSGPTGLRHLADFWSEPLFFFMLLVANSVRFYHGNIRHLDESYLIVSETQSSADDVKRKQQKHLSVDFLVVFIQSLILAFASFYLDDRAFFVSIISGLIVLDIIWSLPWFYYPSSQREFNHKRNWLMNNSFSAIVLLLSFLLLRECYPPLLFTVPALIVLANTIVDFCLSWRFYFPRPDDA